MDRYTAMSPLEMEEFRARMDLPRRARAPRPKLVENGVHIMPVSEPTIRYGVPISVVHSLPPPPMRDDPRLSRQSGADIGPFILLDLDDDEDIRQTYYAFIHLWDEQGKYLTHPRADGTTFKWRKIVSHGQTSQVRARY